MESIANFLLLPFVAVGFIARVTMEAVFKGCDLAEEWIK